MEYEQQLEECKEEHSKEGWKAMGRRKITDPVKMLKQLEVRVRPDEDDSEKVIWKINRFRKDIFKVKAPIAVTREEILDFARKLKIKGFKEAFEEKLSVRIPQDYLDEVGWEAD